MAAVAAWITKRKVCQMDSSAQNAQLRPVGWYMDPGGSGQLKWWDGVGWSTAERASISESGAFGSVRHRIRPLVEATASVYTPYIWLILAVPIFWYLIDALWVARMQNRDDLASAVWVLLPGMGLIVADLVLAYWDCRTLRRAGVVRPFHWVWALIPVVYVIGRTMIVTRVASGRGMAPVWLLLVGALFGWAINATL